MDREEIAILERRLHVVKEFNKIWRLKLLKWDTFIEELHDVEFTSEEEAGKGQADIQRTQKTSQTSTGPRGTSAERGSRQSLLESGNEKSRLKTRSGNDFDRDDRDNDNRDEAQHIGEVQE